MDRTAGGLAGLYAGFGSFLGTLLRNREIVLSLAKSDFKSSYLGSQLNFVWAFIHPCITILTLFLVFEIGFGSRPVQGHPFVIWLMCGMIPWFFLSEAWGNGTNAVTSYSYLVKKVVFRVGILPIVKIISAFFVHAFFLLILLGLLFAYGYRPDPHQLQLAYYLFAAWVLVTGLSWTTSALAVFFRDVGQIVSVLLQTGLWLTPILWDYRNVPARYHPLLTLNPAFYIVEGYRESLLFNTWFWDHPERAVYFWCVALVFFFGGAVVFLKLRPHFADVL
jgi:lipopolysaccharide transport system permease protein/teichoic acid transport system permease protein